MNARNSYRQAAYVDQQALVEEYAPLVKRIAYRIAARLPSCVQIDDLLQAGMIGLLNAARQYHGAHGASFETYAGIRIRGAIWDEIRRQDWVPRSVHRKARDVADAIREIETKTGRDARPEEVIELLGLTQEEYNRILSEALGSRLISVDDIDANAEALQGDSGPLEEVTKQGFLEEVTRAVKSLPEREQMVLSLYYDEELNMREIGEVLEVSESRVCQIHSQAMLRLRARLQDWR